MKYNFDTVPQREGTCSLKFDFKEKYGKQPDILPMWVADMDFTSPPEVIAALKTRAEHGIFGYTMPDDAYFSSVTNWFARRFGYKVQPEWIVTAPGVVFAIAQAVRALTEKGDAVLIQKPVYYPFASIIQSSGRKMVNSPLVRRDCDDVHICAYEIDFEDFERKIVQENVKLFILCSPHNPVGRVWTQEELYRMGMICKAHGVKVIADEIHQDFVYPGSRHTVFADVDESFGAFTVLCTSPSKTFNLAGLQCANIIISNKILRDAFKKQMYASGYSQPNIAGLVTAHAAYTQGEAWLEELLIYLRGNLDFVLEIFRSRLPRVKAVNPQGTYLLWADFSNYGFTAQELDTFLSERAGLWLDGGTMFGEEGAGFARFNIAAPRTVMETAVKKLCAAFGTL